MKKYLRLSFGFWLGFFTIALNQLLDVTLVTTHGQLESASIALTNAAVPVLLPLGCYAAIGVGIRLFAERARRRHVTEGARPQATALTFLRQD
jgi:hypothetical protein